jgi:hypothetical protein
MSNKDIVFYQLSGFYLSLYSKTELAKDSTVEATEIGFKGFTLSYNTASEKEVDDLIHIKKKESGSLKSLKRCSGWIQQLYCRPG